MQKEEIGKEPRKKKRGAGLVCYIPRWWIHSCSLSLPPFLLHFLHPPSTSPFRGSDTCPLHLTNTPCGLSLPPPPKKSLVKWQWTKSCWLAPGSRGERKSGEGRRISGLMPTSGHSSVNRCTAQCGSAQHSTETWMETRIWVGLLHCCGSPLEWYSWLPGSQWEWKEWDKGREARSTFFFAFKWSREVGRCRKDSCRYLDA